MPAVIVVVPLRSIDADQVKNDEFDLKATQLSLDQQKLQAVASGEVRVLYTSAEEVLDDRFVDLLKQDRPFRQNLALIVVDAFRWEIPINGLERAFTKAVKI